VCTYLPAVTGAYMEISADSISGKNMKNWNKKKGGNLKKRKKAKRYRESQS
jgi:hypothetical protein